MPDFVFEAPEQVHVILLALVAGRGEVEVVVRRRVYEPAPAGGHGVEPKGAAGGDSERGAVEVGDAGGDADKRGDIDGAPLPPRDRSGVGSQGIVESSHGAAEFGRMAVSLELRG